MFCNKCGKEIQGNVNFCNSCGNPLNGVGNNAEKMLHQLSERYKINGIIWIVVAVIQIILGIFVNWICLIVGVLNIISAIQDIIFSGKMLKNPNGIVDKVRPLVGAILILIYNVIFGGVLGVAGSIYYLVGIRNFVMKNEGEFKSLEIQA